MRVEGLTKVQERRQRLEFLVGRCHWERALPGYRGGQAAAKIRDAAEKQWRLELARLVGL